MGQKNINTLELSFITPTSQIKEFGSQSDFILALSHLIDLEKENDYEKAIKETGLEILCDNGLFENHVPEPIDSLLDKAIRIRAFGFFAPDHLYNPIKTKQEIDKAYEVMCKRGLVEGYKNYVYGNKIKLFAVVQADNKEDWLKQYVEFCEDERIDGIGWSILSIPKAWNLPVTEARIECMKEVLKLDVEHKRGHLLGIGNGYADVLFAKKYCPFIKSNDSSCAFQSGLFEKRLNEELEVPGGKIKEKVDFNLKEITKNQRENIQYNINIIKKYVCN